MRVIVVRARESFWFLPAVLGIVAIILAEALIGVDRAIPAAASLPFVSDLSATGGRAVLSAVGVTMLTVAATTFSITISVLATTSSTYGPRLVRNFMADRGNQLVLATLTSSFLYALFVLRAVRTKTDATVAFVPDIAVSFVLVLAVIDVSVLVYFIHHIATSVQVTTLQKRVLVELMSAIDEVYADEGPPASSRELPRPGLGAPAVTAAHGGYVQDVDVRRLCRLAERMNIVVAVAAMPGSHVIVGDSLLMIMEGEVKDSRGAMEDLRRAFAVGDSRTPHQDVAFAVQQLVEVGVRGLASGTNDPYTAVSALDDLGAALVPLFGRPEAPRAAMSEDGVPRVILSWPSCGEAFTQVAQAVRVYATGHPIVIDAMSRLGGRVGRASNTPARRAEVISALRSVRDAYEATSPQPPDLAGVLEVMDRELATFAHAPADDGR